MKDQMGNEWATLIAPLTDSIAEGRAARGPALLDSLDAFRALNAIHITH
jgi:hypothetical protein